MPVTFGHRAFPAHRAKFFDQTVVVGPERARPCEESREPDGLVLRASVDSELVTVCPGVASHEAGWRFECSIIRMG